MRKINYKKILLYVVVIALIAAISFLSFFLYVESNRKQKESLRINSITSDITNINESLEIYTSVKWKKLNIDIKNIWPDNILWLRFFIKFKNVFWEEVLSCMESCYLLWGYDSRFYIESQKILKKWEILSLNKSMSFWEQNGNWLRATVNEYQNNEKISISSFVIYETIFSEGKHIKLNDFCNSRYKEGFQYSDLTSVDLCIFETNKN